MNTHKTTFKTVVALAVAVLIGVVLGALIFGSDNEQSKTKVVTITTDTYNLEDRCGMLGYIRYYAGKVYKGTLGIEDFGGAHGDGVSSTDLPANLGYPIGYAGVRAFLADVKSVMIKPGYRASKVGDNDYWSPFTNVIITNHKVDPELLVTYVSPDGVVGFNYDGNANDDLSPKLRRALYRSINPEAKSEAGLFGLTRNGYCYPLYSFYRS